MYFIYKKNCTNLSDEECIPEDWKQRYPFEYLLSITVIYCAIFLVGTIGNLTTCLVIYRTKFMHTATNYYLFNLSISDVFLLILRLPFDVYAMWKTSAFPNSYFMCCANNLFSEMCTYSSVLTIVAFTIERYLAICHPMRFQSNAHNQADCLKRAFKVTAIIWLISAFCGSLMASQTGLIKLYKLLPDGYSAEPVSGVIMCQVLPDRVAVRYLFAISSVTFFLIPIALISVLYILIGLTVQRSGRELRRNSTSLCQTSDSANGASLTTCEKINCNATRARRVVLKMLVAVVIAFFICFAPFQVNRMLGALVPVSVFEKYPWIAELDKAIFGISGIFFYCSSIVNPILYNLMSIKFRKAFCNTIFYWCCKSYWSTNSERSRISTAQHRFPRNNEEYAECLIERKNFNRDNWSMIPKKSFTNRANNAPIKDESNNEACLTKEKKRHSFELHCTIAKKKSLQATSLHLSDSFYAQLIQWESNNLNEYEAVTEF